MSPVESQFHVSPFPPFPSTERYVRMGSQDDALLRVVRAVEAWEAISLVIGPPGTGKSLICRMLKNHFADRREVIVFGDAMLENPASLQRHLLSRLDRIRGISSATSTGTDDPQLAIIERIASSSKEFAGLLLLVDEAQDLSPETLETIRILTNTMTADGRPRVSAVLAGAPKLDETLALPSLEALVQRVATRCYVHPLSSDETVQYVRQVLHTCGGWDESQIEESAIRSVHRACSGVPRLINQLMTASIEYAQSRGRKQLTGQTVDQAWAILQQLPSPIIDEPELSQPTHEIEFGPLCDETPIRDETACAAEQCAAEQCAAEQCAAEPCAAEPCGVEQCTVEQAELSREECEPIDSITRQDPIGLSEPQEEWLTEPESINDGFDSIELEPCDTPQLGPDENVDSVENHFSIVADDEQASTAQASALESLSMDCQTIGNFDCDQSHFAEYRAEAQGGQASPIDAEPMSFDSLAADSNPADLNPADLNSADLNSADSNPVDSNPVESVSAETIPTATVKAEAEELFGDFEEEEAVEIASESLPLSMANGQTFENKESKKEDLESSLHREILSLRGAATAPVEWMDEGDADMLIEDDRDLLVIEDEVDVDGPPVSNVVEEDLCEAEPMAVDFQAMLAKMRSPGK